jgi:hypothetical protein
MAVRGADAGSQVLHGVAGELGDAVVRSGQGAGDASQLYADGLAAWLTGSIFSE